MSDHTNDHDKLIDLMQDLTVGMFTTTADDGTLHSIPMSRQDVDFDSELWFITVKDADHVRNLQARPSVGVTFSGGSSWVSVQGQATLVDDEQQLKELWNTFAEAWLPGGPEDSNAALIRVDLDGGEYWDSPGNKVASLISFAKAKVTGEPLNTGHGSADL